MTLIFNSFDQKVHYAIICKNTDNFSQIEQILYEKFPEYKETENYFLYGSRKINRYKTIEENGLEYSAFILFNKN